MINEERLRQTFSEGGAQEIYQDVKASGDFLGFAHGYAFSEDYQTCFPHVQVLPRIDGWTEAHSQSNGDRLLQTCREVRQKQNTKRKTKVIKDETIQIC